jgi:hypothetical protein
VAFDRVPPELGTVVIRDLDGAAVELGSLWRDRPIVLVFLRHFG